MKHHEVETVIDFGLIPDNMFFLCPACGHQSLSIEKSVELTESPTYDEVAIQAIECQRCSLKGMAVYEESRRGQLDQETIHHYGYRLPEESFDWFYTLLSHIAFKEDALSELSNLYSTNFSSDQLAFPGFSERFEMKLKPS